MIHTIGDSHAKIPWEKISNTSINWLGPKLMYTFGKIGTNLIDIKDIKLSANDTLIFCFGEIDCRCQVYKFDFLNSYKIVIDRLVEKYIKTILAIKNNIDVQCNIYIYNVIPPIRKTIGSENSQYPFLGNDEQRKKYTTYMNFLLKKKCNSKGLLFFDIYDKYCDRDGFLEPTLSDYICHINDPNYIVQYLEEIDAE